MCVSDDLKVGHFRGFDTGKVTILDNLNNVGILSTVVYIDVGICVVNFVNTDIFYSFNDFVEFFFMNFMTISS